MMKKLKMTIAMTIAMIIIAMAIGSMLAIAGCTRATNDTNESTLSSGTESNIITVTIPASEWSQSGSKMECGYSTTVSGYVSSATVTAVSGGLVPSASNWSTSIRYNVATDTSTITYSATATGIPVIVETTTLTVSINN